MVSASFFGEITELNSRAVWYSDEEDDDEIEELELSPKVLSPLGPLTHETSRSSILLNFQRVVSEPNPKFEYCVISLLSSAHFRNFKPDIRNSLLGHFDRVGKAFACPINSISGEANEKPERLLWLLFDSSNRYVSSQEVGYFVERLRETIAKEFDLGQQDTIIILSEQFSTSEHLEYLGNYQLAKKLPFSGRPIAPPSLIKNQFESSLFEQLTISLRQAYVVCLPNPKSFWFDNATNWPTIPNQIIEQKLNDDSLEMTLIFT